MTKETFLSQLGSALSGNMDSGKVNENLRYYSEYISGEVQGGPSLGFSTILFWTFFHIDSH